jgi:hypothetical protein
VEREREREREREITREITLAKEKQINPGAHYQRPIEVFNCPR